MINATSSYPPGFSDNLSVVSPSPVSSATPNYTQFNNNQSNVEQPEKSKQIKTISVLFWILFIFSTIQFVILLLVPHVISIATQGVFGNTSLFPLDYSLLLMFSLGIFLTPIVLFIQMIFYYLSAKEVFNRTRKSWWLALWTVIIYPLSGLSLYLLLLKPINSFSNQGFGDTLEPISNFSPLEMANLSFFIVIIILILLVINWKKFSLPTRTQAFPKKGLIILVTIGVVVMTLNAAAIFGQTYLNDKGKSFVTTQTGQLPLEPMQLPLNLQVERFMIIENPEVTTGEDSQLVQTVVSSPFTSQEPRGLIIIREVQTNPGFDFEKKAQSYLDGKPGEKMSDVSSQLPYATKAYLITKPLGEGELVVVIGKMDNSYVTIVSPRSSVENVLLVAGSLRRDMKQESTKREFLP